MSTGPRRDAGLTAATELAASLLDNLASVVRGDTEPLRLALVALLSGGHLLVEGVPGVGKTLLAKALARSIDGSFRRVQATPDLLPADLTGVSVYSPATAEWTFRAGPLFAHVVLVDELNRATPRTQAALLEAMEERQVTVDGESHPLPAPFFLVATQNSLEHAGTFPLVEGQRDRFAVAVLMGHPGRDAERELLRGVGGLDLLADLTPVTDTAELARAVASVRRVHCADPVVDYVVELVAGTRDRADVAIGASPRATLALLHAAQAGAAVAGRAYVIPDDVKSLAAPVLGHRLVLHGADDLAAGVAVVRDVLDAVPVPRE